MSDLTTKAAEVRAGLDGADEFDAPETMSPQDTARDLVDRFRSGDCPFCGHDPYHYVDNGVGMERVAVTCCDLGIALFQEGDEQLSRASGERHEAANALADLLALIEQQTAEPRYHSQSDALCKQQAAELAEARALVSSSEAERYRSCGELLARATTAESERDEARAVEDQAVGRMKDAIADAAARKLEVRQLEEFIGRREDDILEIARSALENGPAGLADAHSKSPAPSSQSERIAALEAVARDLVASLNIRGKMISVDHDELFALERRARSAIGCRPAVPYRPRNFAEADKGLSHDRENCLPPDDHRVPDAAHAALSSTPLGEAGDLLTTISNLPEDFVDDGNCCAGKLKEPRP